MKKELNIVCHDVPYPLDYGGVFDLYCKLKSLKEAGVDIYLHCFEYGRGRQPELNRYCEEVYYYPRNEGHKGFSASLPYIVCSRSHPDLTQNLLKNDFPILLEGIHCSYIVNCENFRDRSIFLRLHNVECDYYRRLFRHERSPFKKAYYYHESRLLQRYEKRLAESLPIAAVAHKDVITYRQKFHAGNIRQLPAFIPWQEVKSREGIGTYCLYHGNLSVAENEEAAAWLIEKIFRQVKVPFVIAGKNPSSRLEKLAHRQANTCLVANPAEDEMNDLIAKAQINVLPSLNETGIKLKLINALFNGRHCVVNDAAVEETGLGPACHIGSGEEAFRQIIAQLYHQPFTTEEIQLRRHLCGSLYNNALNARELIAWIW